MYRNRAALAALLAVLAGMAPLAAGAQSEEPPAVPVSPEVLAQGGSFTANAEGFQALFHNPAAFASERRSLTFLAASGWVYAHPVRFFHSPAPASLLEEEVTSGGFGMGSAAGIGWVGRGLGLGAVLGVDSYLWGPTAAEAKGRLTADLQFVGGLAVKAFQDRLWLGADVRPLIRLAVPVDYNAMFGFYDALGSGGDPLAALESCPALHGFGFGIDLGALLELGGWRFGLSVRDFLGTSIVYRQSTFGEVRDALRKTGGFPSNGAAVVPNPVIPMELSLGLSYRFDFGSRTIDPVVHASFSDLIAVIQGERSPWTALHLGAEVRLWRFLALRAGLNQGYLTFGGGLRMPLLELNAAFFTREMGRNLGDRPSSGLALEAALRLQRSEPRAGAQPE
jgi:hypothetical protein